MVMTLFDKIDAFAKLAAYRHSRTPARDPLSQPSMSERLESDKLKQEPSNSPSEEWVIRIRQYTSNRHVNTAYVAHAIQGMHGMEADGTCARPNQAESWNREDAEGIAARLNTNPAYKQDSISFHVERR